MRRGDSSALVTRDQVRPGALLRLDGDSGFKRRFTDGSGLWMLGIGRTLATSWGVTSPYLDFEPVLVDMSPSTDFVLNAARPRDVREWLSELVDV